MRPSISMVALMELPPRQLDAIKLSTERRLSYAAYAIDAVL
jgi:hypothetical protein